MRTLSLLLLLAAIVLSSTGCAASPVAHVPQRNPTGGEYAKAKAFCDAFQTDWQRKYPEGWKHPERYAVNVGIHLVEPIPHPPLRIDIQIEQATDLSDVLAAIGSAYDAAKIDDVDIIIRRTFGSDVHVIARICLSRAPSDARPSSWYQLDPAW